MELLIPITAWIDPENTVLIGGNQSQKIMHYIIPFILIMNRFWSKQT